MPIASWFKGPRVRLGPTVCALLSFSLSGCWVPPESVSRMADGVIAEGRFIAPEAYGAYARAALLEARGDKQGALAFYDLALRNDPNAPEILARIAILSCELAKTRSDEAARRAERALNRALAVDASSSLALSAQARCFSRFGEHGSALSSALLAARADPESMPLQLLVVKLAEAAGELDRARVWLDALVVRSPESRLAWLYLADFAERTKDPGRALRAARALEEDGAGVGERALTDAILQGDLDRARRLALELRVTPGELAARAALQGAEALSREQAELVLAADPSDPNAWITKLALEDLSRNSRELEKTLLAAPRNAATPPSPSARRLHGELLERLVGSDARRAWERAF